MALHAKLSASGSAKWLTCPAALATEEILGLPDESSEAADEGTAAHFLASECLIQDLPPQHFIGDYIQVVSGDPAFLDGEYDGLKPPGMFKIDAEMVDAVETYIQYVKNLQGKSHFYEVKLDYSHVAPEGFGTSDCVVETVEKVEGKPCPTLYVIDLKYGKGIRVEAFENSQGMLYAVGALNSLEYLLEREIKRVIIVIVQPRMDNISEYEISVEDLKKWAEETVKPKAYIASQLMRNPDTIAPEHYKPSEKGCKWCKAKAVCKARANQGFEAAVEGFEPVSDLSTVEVTEDKIKNPNILSNNELAAVYSKIKLFQDWANGLQKLIIEKITNGEHIPGLGLKSTTGNRAWSLKDDELTKALRTAGLQKKDYEKVAVISPTEAEKKLKKLKPKDHEKRYKKLEKAAIVRPAGPDKLVVVDNNNDLDGMQVVSEKLGPAINDDFLN